MALGSIILSSEDMHTLTEGTSESVRVRTGNQIKVGYVGSQVLASILDTDARAAMSAASSGYNGDITSINGLTTALPRSMGGTGQTSISVAIYQDTSTQTLAAASFSLINPATVVLDNLGEFSAGAFTATADGLYQIACNCMFSAVTTADSPIAVVATIDDAAPTAFPVGTSQSTYGSTANITSLTLSTFVYLTAGKVLRFYAYSGDTADMSLTAKDIRVVRII